MKAKKVFFIALVVVIIMGIVAVLAIGGNRNKSNAKYKVVASNFASYDSTPKTRTREIQVWVWDR